MSIFNKLGIMRDNIKKKQEENTKQIKIETLQSELLVERELTSKLADRMFTLENELKEVRSRLKKEKESKIHRKLSKGKSKIYKQRNI